MNSLTSHLDPKYSVFLFAIAVSAPCKSLGQICSPPTVQQVQISFDVHQDVLPPVQVGDTVCNPQSGWHFNIPFVLDIWIDVAIGLEVETSMDLEMPGDVQAEYPIPGNPSKARLKFLGDPNGGWLEIHFGAGFVFKICIDAILGPFSCDFEFCLGEGFHLFQGSTVFGPFVLPGNPDRPVCAGDTLNPWCIGLDPCINICGNLFCFDANLCVDPDLDFCVSGNSICVSGQCINQENGTMLIPVSGGSLGLISTFNGSKSLQGNVLLDPNLCFTVLGYEFCLPIPSVNLNIPSLPLPSLTSTDEFTLDFGDIQLPTELWDFGSVCVGQQEQENRTITNTGFGALKLCSVSENGVDFTVLEPIVPPSVTIQPENSRSLVIKFQPLSPEFKTATLTIQSDDPDENTLSIALSGNAPNGTCCQSNSQCADNNPCTDNVCNAGTCVITYNTNSCDDGNACTINDTCSGGQCVGGPAPTCDDNNACTTDTCNAQTGCVNTNNSLACDDSQFCNGADTCNAGSCSSHAGNPCIGGATCDEVTDSCILTPCTCPDDDNPCTDEVCIGDQCAHPNNSSSCYDGLFCNGADTCAAGSCSVHAGNPCSIGTTCDEASDSCKPECVCPDDGNPCTKEQCAGSVCHTVLVDGCCMNNGQCDDADTCTNDTCVSNLCAHAFICPCASDDDCNDENACTNDQCVVNECVNSVISGCCLADRECNDNNPMTVDRCSNNECRNNSSNQLSDENHSNDNGNIALTDNNEPGQDVSTTTGCGVCGAMGSMLTLPAYAFGLLYLRRLGRR